MKRTLTLAALTAVALTLMVGTAGANKIPTDEVIIGCDLVGFDWQGFPQRPVDLIITVDFLDQDSTTTVSTEGAPEGVGAIPLSLTGSGTASVTVTWVLGETEHQSGPVFAELECETPPTTPTTGSPVTPPSEPPAPAEPPHLTPPVGCGPGTLPCTGLSSSTWVLIGSGWALLALGTALIWGAVVRRGER